MYIWKTSAIKIIKISVQTIIKIMERNTRIQKVSNSQIKGVRKMSTKYAKFFKLFVKYILKTFFES